MKTIRQNWGGTLVLFFLVLLSAFALRLYNLTYLPVFGDEAIYIRWAQIMRSEPTLRFIPLSDGKQPLFMWLVIPFFKIFADPLFAGRLVSVVSGVGTVIGVFVLTYILFKSKKVSLTASLFYTFSPYTIFFDRLAIADSLLSMFGVWTLVFTVLTVKKFRLDAAILAGFSLGGALLTKSPAIFFALLTPLTTILINWPRILKEKFTKFSVLVFLFSFTYLVGYGMYNILRLGPNFHMVGLRNKDYVFPLSRVFEAPLDPLLPFLDRSREWLWMLGPGIIVIFIGAGIILNFRKNTKEILLLTTWAFIPLVVSAEYAKVFTARYIFFILPYLFILAAAPFLLPRFLKFAKAGLVIFVLHALWINFLILTNIEKAPLPRSERSGYLEEWTSGEGLVEISQLVRNEYLMNPAQKIVVGTEGYFGTLPDGLQMYLNDVPEVTVIGTGFNQDKLPSSLSESLIFGNKTYFVINSSRFSGNKEKLGLRLIAEYPKAEKPDGDREKLLFFEVQEVSVSSQ